MKKYILFMIIILFYQTLFCEEANSKLVSHIDLFSVSWHYRPHILYSIQDANGTLNSLKWSKTSSKYIVKNEKIENFENSKCDTGAFTFYNMISDSLFCAGISGYLNDYEFKDIDISEYECRTLCLVIYNDNTVQYVSFYKNEMIINGNQLKLDKNLLEKFYPYLTEYQVKSIKYYVDVAEEELE